MDFSEFKRRVGAEPGSQDPEVLAARRSGPEFEQAAGEAEVFERKLQAALQVPVDPGLTEDLLKQVHARRRPPRWLALAAAVVLAVGAGSVAWLGSRPPQDVHQYVVEHVAHDGADLLARAGGWVSADEMAAVLTGFGVSAAPDLANRVRLIKFCPTPDGRGAHMVLDTESGPVQLIYMPATHVQDGDAFGFDGLDTRLVQLDRGSAAIVGAEGADLVALSRLVKTSLLPYEAST